MLENAHSGHTATAELFERPTTIETHLEEALARFNIDLQHFPELNRQDDLHPFSHINTDVLTRIAQANSSVNDLKLQFKNACDILLQNPQ
jgi:hypothetical protein